ncbi:NADH-quinone oxidoreductase subunit G [Malonomonas rubra DSM 5091]|uniref:NADH-quinone oxidoreductase subunit G n=1 Tax=Malonomonas rubra DSM 5091 TaxID=1122189 RepID=A0A1M6HJ18_MALRU|nr:NADH-quinone oxidoreductase subunit NuoG [Malonomonas rubra]SHJ22191.1 NADH-quinone oxidoreductase subunit G [Malonomonas rubra DSM 5091]
MVNLTIDGKQVTVSKDATIYEAAKQAGIYIPVLCYAKKLLPYGACRVCLVEVEQMKGRLIPSCTTPVTEGMVVTTMSDEIRKVRKTVLEFLLVNHVVDCPVCDKGGECDLQELTYEYEVVTNRFEGEKFDLPTDEVNPLIERNMNRCVLCGKCVRVCDEIVGYGSYSFINRGFETKIATAFDRGLNCEFCGQCVSMCPVGAILPRPFKFKARPWQLKEVDTVCGYCGNGCTITLGTKDNEVQTIRFNDETGVNDGNLCIRGRFGYSYVNSADKLTSPMVRRDGQLVEASWDEAIQAVSDGFKAAGDSLGIISGARLTNEELFLLKNYSKALGTENLDHSGGECYKGVTEGLQETLGIKASTATFPQVEKCDAILSIRSDFYETHPVFGMVVNQAIRRNEAKLTVVADKLGKFTKLPNARTLLHKPALELNIINAICSVLLEEGLAKTDGLEGLDDLKKGLKKFTAKAVAKETGVDEEAIKQTARELAAAENAAILLAYGLPYTAYSKELGIAAANLSLLTGIAGRQGSGLYLCGEKANSQGAIDLGILPGAKGIGAQQMLDDASTGKLKALYMVGEDPIASYPNRGMVEKAMDNAFLVVQDLFLTETAAKADVVLPAVSFAEKDGTFTNAERRIQKVRKGIKSKGDAKSDFEILQLLLSAAGKDAPATTTDAFAALTAETSGYEGITLDMLGKQGYVWGTDILKPVTSKLVAVGGGEASKSKYQLLVGSALYHSGTVSTKAKGPNAVVSEAYIEVCREDAAELKLEEGDLLKLKAEGGELKAKVKVDRRLPQGVMFAPYHFSAMELNRVYTGQPVIAVEPVK